MPELALRDVLVRAPGESGRAEGRALDGVDLVIERGELVAVMGATGAGKSTLALSMAGLVQPDRGHVEGAAAGQVRLVLQRPEATFLADTVLEEVMLALEARGEPRHAAGRHAQALLELLGLGPQFADRDPLALSGGEQRRVAIAATLAADARVLVLDEPSAGLDHAARARLHAALRQLHAADRTIVLVTHDPDEAASLATRLVVLAEGRVVADAPPSSVLGDPQAAARVGLAVSPEVQLLHDVAADRGLAMPPGIATARDALDALAAMVAGEEVATREVAPPQRPGGAAAAPMRDAQPAARTPLPVLVDSRPRILAAAAAMVAALAATSLLAAAIVLAACVGVVVAARVGRARLQLTVRPLLALAVLLVALQLLLGGAPDVDLRHGVPARFDAAPALMRAAQAGAVMFAALALSATTTPLDLATGLRRLAAPLVVLRVPVAALSFVVATALGLVPAMADELERLRLAQRARGLRPAARSPLARLRADARLVGPLFVSAFRRAHLLADALAVRGIDPRRPVRPWRPMTIPAIDPLLCVAGIALVLVARFA